MGIISADLLSGALAKARGIGIVEETFTVRDTALTLRSLRPDEYSAILRECEGLEDVEYLMAYQKGHVIRSIVEINGFDLRDVDFIEVQEGGKTVKLEKHDWLRKNLVDSWGKEVLFVVYQKFGDVVKRAEDGAQEGVEFLVPDETPEQKYRRLMGDLKEIEDDVPSDLLKEILDDAGFMKKSTAQELKAAMERTDALKREQEAKAAAEAAPAPTPAPTDLRPPGATPPQAQTPTPAEVQAENERIMAARQPMNRAPQDPHVALQTALQTAASQPQGEPAPSPAPAPVQAPVQPPVQVDKVAQERAAKIAAMEADGPVPVASGDPIFPERPQEVAVLTGKQPGVDPKELVKTIDQPPKAGLNPRYNPPKRF